MEQQNHTNDQGSGQRTHNPPSTNGAHAAGHEAPDSLRQSTERRTEDQEYYQGFLERLLDLVCHGDQETISRMIAVIRSGASQQEILALLNEVSEGDGHSSQGDSSGSHDRSTRPN